MPQDLIGCRKRRKLKALIPRVVVFVNDPPSAERRIDFAVFFIVLYSLMVGKYALICVMEIQKIHMVVHIISGFALFTELMGVYRGVESLCKLLTANKEPFDLPTNKCKSKYCPSELVSFESSAGNDFSLRKKPQSPTVKY